MIVVPYNQNGRKKIEGEVINLFSCDFRISAIEISTRYPRTKI